MSQTPKNTELVTYTPAVDLKEFRLVSEPTLDALANDGRKFFEIVEKGSDYQLLGTFLLGVTLLKVKKMIGGASRGNTAKGESGFMDWKKTAFPNKNKNALNDAAQFTKSVFAQWEKAGVSEEKGKIPIMGILQTGSILDFQLPENADELRGLLQAIHDTMDGRTMTAICRGVGRIRQAQIPGTYARKPRDLRAAIEEAAEVDEEACKSWLSDTLMLADGRSPILGEQKNSTLYQMERTAAALLERIRALIKSRKTKKS
jgi:hypothetical protein